MKKSILRFLGTMFGVSISTVLKESREKDNGIRHMGYMSDFDNDVIGRLKRIEKKIDQRGNK